MEAEGVIRVIHLDVFNGVVIINIYLMTGEHQQENVVIVRNVYANQKHVSNAQSIHIVKVVSTQHVHLVQIINIHILKQDGKNVLIIIANQVKVIK